jgi:hypothetical protein
MAENETGYIGDQPLGDAVQPPAPETKAPDTNPTVVPDSGSAATDPTKNGTPTETTGRNWQDEAIRTAKVLEQERKNFNELRKKLIAQGTERNNFEREIGPLREQLKTLTEALSKAANEELTPEQFLEGLQTQGPKFLENFLAKRDKDLSDRFEARAAATEARLRKREVAAAVKDRRSDTQNFPDFAKLEPTMSEIMVQMREEFKAGLLPTNPDSVDPDELTDYLYNLAKLQHSQDAIKAAEAEGAAKARAGLAREAETSVPGGGKNTSSQPIDFDKLSVADARKLVVARHGEAE